MATKSNTKVTKPAMTIEQLKADPNTAPYADHAAPVYGRGAYAGALTRWQPEFGAMPVTELGWVHKLGKRPGHEAFALAMRLRPEGATKALYIKASGAVGPAENCARNLVEAGILSRRVEAGVISLALTDKGKALVGLTTAPAKPKATKPAKPKAKVSKPVEPVEPVDQPAAA